MQPAILTPRRAIPMGVMFPSLGELGQGTTGTQDLQQMTSMAGTLGVTAGSLIAYMVGASAVIPIFGAAVAAAVGVAILIESMFKGCGDTCVEATNIANQVEVKLKENVQNYLSQSIRYKSSQQLFLQVFDNTWQMLLNACGNPALGDAGRRCISERQRGGVAPWCPKPGHVGCDWFALYRDPIANDPSAVPDPDTSSPSVQMQAVTNPDGSVTYVPAPSSPSGLPMPLLLGVAALFIFVMMGAKK